MGFGGKPVAGTSTRKKTLKRGEKGKEPRDTGLGEFEQGSNVGNTLALIPTHDDKKSGRGKQLEE